MKNLLMHGQLQPMSTVDCHDSVNTDTKLLQSALSGSISKNCSTFCIFFNMLAFTQLQNNNNKIIKSFNIKH